MTLRAAFNAYRMDVIMYRNQSRKTEENHLIVCKNLVNYFGDIQIEALSFEMIRDWKLSLDKTRSPETVRNYIIKLRVVLAYLKNRGITCVDPSLVAVPKRTDKVLDFITENEVQRLIKATSKLRNKAIISLLYASGIRVSELCRMDRGDIKNGSFTVVGKGGKARLCFVDQRTCELLKKYLCSRRDNNPALFTGKFPTHRITVGNVQEIFRYARVTAGFDKPIHPHTLRHSFATNLLRSNCNIRYVQEMLGHSSLETTQMYTHTTNYDLQSAYNKHHTI